MNIRLYALHTGLTVPQVRRQIKRGEIKAKKIPVRRFVPMFEGMKTYWVWDIASDDYILGGEKNK